MPAYEKEEILAWDNVLKVARALEPMHPKAQHKAFKRPAAAPAVAPTSGAATSSAPGGDAPLLTTKFGCSKCRHAAGGCMKCNPAKKRAYLDAKRRRGK